MKAHEHARFCKDCSDDLFNTLNKGKHDNLVLPVFKLNAKYREFQTGNIYCYVHPKDKDVEYIEDFKYPHREL